MGLLIRKGVLNRERGCLVERGGAQWREGVLIRERECLLERGSA